MTWKKYIAILLAAVLMAPAANAQAKKYDSLAIIVMDRMSDVISEMESCHFRLHVANDEPGSGAKGLVKNFTDYEIFLSGPDKMLVKAKGYKGHRQFMYNGSQMAFFSFDENNYGLVPAPSTTMQMIDSLHEQFDFDFPAMDFFYPAFTDDVLQDADSVLYLGKIRMQDQEYFHIIAFNSRFTFQCWINNDAYNLPAKFSITYKSQPGSPQYFASFSDWEVNPKLPSGMFDFLPPPGAKRIRIMSKTDR